MACIEYNGKKYMKSQFKKHILENPDDFLSHVADEEILKSYAKKPGDKMAEFDELLDAKKGIDTKEVPAEIKKQLEDASNELSPEEQTVLDGFGKSLEDARTDRGSENESPVENSKPESDRPLDSETTEPIAESPEKPGGESDQLREGAIPQGEGREPSKRLTKREQKKILQKERTKLLQKEPQALREAILQWFAGGGKVNTDDVKRYIGTRGKEDWADIVGMHKHGGPKNEAAQLANELFGRWKTGGVDEQKIANEIFSVLKEFGGKRSAMEAELRGVKEQDDFLNEHGMDKKTFDHVSEQEQIAEDIKEELPGVTDEHLAAAEDIVDKVSLSTEDNASIDKYLEQFTDADGNINWTEALEKADEVFNDETLSLTTDALNQFKELFKNHGTQKEYGDKGLQPKEVSDSSSSKEVSSNAEAKSTKGQEVKFDHAGSERTGKVIEELSDGKIKVQEKDGIKHIIKKESARFQKESTSAPIARAKLNTAIARVKRLFPNIEITNDSKEWSQALKEAKPEEMKQTPNGFVYKGKLYLNPDITKIKGDTVAHEAQHIANEVMKAKEPDMWRHGVKLALQEGAIERLRELYPHLHNDEAIADEFIADATGKRVEQLDAELEKAGMPARIINQITDWVQQAKDWIREKLGFDNNMTFEEFIDRAAKLQRKGKKISDVATADIDESGRFQFVGENKAKLDEAQRRGLNIAKSMKGDGASKEEIYKETGWFVGQDGNWRTQLSNKNFDYNPGNITEGKLGDVLKYPELFSAYPEIKNINFEIKKLPTGIDGNYDPDTNTISVRDSSPIDRQISTVRHELQHYIQLQEGFARGASFRSVTEALRAEIQGLVQDIGNLEASQKDKGLSAADNTRLAAKRRELKNLQDNFDWEVKSAYHRTSGEGESRLVDKRSPLSDSEIKNIYPTYDIPDDIARFQISDEEAQKMSFGKKPEDDRFIDTAIAPDAKKEVIPATSSITLLAETRYDLISALRSAGLWDKKNVTTYDKDGNILRVGEIRKPADEQKSVDALRGAINDFIKKIDLKLHTEDGSENKKSFQLDLENLRDEISDPKTIPAIKEILKDLTGETKIMDVPVEELTKAQKQAKKFYTDVLQLKKQASYIEQTKGAVITSNTSYIPKEQVREQTVREFKNRFPEFEKYKDVPGLKKIISSLEWYVRATSGVTGFGKFLTGKTDGLINASTKALSQAPGKAFRIKQTAERLTEGILHKNYAETRNTYTDAKSFEKTKPVDINTITGSELVPGGLKVSPKELNDIYLTLRQPDVNRTYFSNEREAGSMQEKLDPKEKELAELQAKDQTNLDQREKNAIDEKIEDLTAEIQKRAGEIDKLKKGIQGFTFPAIEGVRPETTIKVSSENFGKIREYARAEFGEHLKGWEDAANFIHPFLNQAFNAENGINLKWHDKFYPLTHGKPNEVKNYQKEQKFIDDFRSAKYRAPATEGNNYLVLSSDIKMQNYINSSAKYAAYAPVIRNMDAIMKSLEGTASKADHEWWNKQKAHAEDPNRFGGVMGEMGELEKKLYAGFSTSVLGLNPFIPPKEIGAVLLGTSEIESKYLMPQIPGIVANLGSLLKSFNPLALRTYDAVEKEMMEHNDMANMRLQSGITDYAELSREMGKMKIPGTEKEIDLSKATEPMLMAHRMVQKAYWQAAKAKIDAEQPELKNDAYWKAVGDIYERVTLATQPSIDTFNGPSFRKETNALTRSLSIFGGQGFVNMNNMAGKVMAYMHNPDSVDAKIKVAKTFANVFVINTLMLSAVNHFRPGSGDEEKDKDKAFFSLLRESTKSVPIFSPIADAVINKYQSPAFGYGVELPVIQVVNEFADGIAGLSKGKFEHGIDDMLRVFAAAKGIPITPYETVKKVLK